MLPRKRRGGSDWHRMIAKMSFCAWSVGKRRKPVTSDAGCTWKIHSHLDLLYMPTVHQKKQVPRKRHLDSCIPYFVAPLESWKVYKTQTNFSLWSRITGCETRPNCPPQLTLPYGSSPLCWWQLRWRTRATIPSLAGSACQQVGAKGAERFPGRAFLGAGAIEWIINSGKNDISEKNL